MTIETIGEQELESTITTHKQALVIDIWMDDCPPCNMLAPKLKAVAQDYKNRVSVFKIKVDDDSPILENHGIEVIPTLLFFKNGNEISRLEGMAHSKELDQHFKQVIEN